MRGSTRGATVESVSAKKSDKRRGQGQNGELVGVGGKGGCECKRGFKYGTLPVILVMENVLGLAEWFFRNRTLRYVALFENEYKEGCQTVGVTRHKRQVHSPPTNNAVKGEFCRRT